MDAGDELVDVVDEHDVVVGTVTRRQVRAERLRHRSVAVAVIHPDGRLLVHRRSEAKDIWPGRWDLAVGGVVGAGESYAGAARREAEEEVGIVGVELEEIGGGAYTDADVAMIGRCFRITHPGPFSFADGEVAEARWVTAAELGAMRRAVPFVPDSVAVLLPLLAADFRTV